MQPIEVIIRKAYQNAKKMKHKKFSSVHILGTLLENDDGSLHALVEESGGNVERLEKGLAELNENFSGGKSDVTVSGEIFPQELLRKQEIEGIIGRTSQKSKALGDDFLAMDALFVAICESDQEAIQLLIEDANIDVTEMEDFIPENRKTFLNPKDRSDEDGSDEDGGDALPKYTTDFTDLAERGKLDPVIGRDDELKDTIKILMRRKKSNPVLVGMPGVGKTAIVEGLAQRIVANQVPECLMGKTILSLDVGRLVAGASFYGEFEARMKEVLDEVIASDGEVILFIDEMHMIIGAGRAKGSTDVSNLLKPALARGEISCIGATTIDEYRKHIEPDGALDRRFQPVAVDELNVVESVRVLGQIKELYEIHHKAAFSDAALVTAAILSRRHKEGCLPDKAIELMEEAAIDVRVNGFSKRGAMPVKLKNLETEIRALCKSNNVLCYESRSGTSEGASNARGNGCSNTVLDVTLEIVRKTVDAKFKTDKREIGPTHVAKVISNLTATPVERLLEKVKRDVPKMREVSKKTKNKYKFMSKRIHEFADDFTELAEHDELDPVIGRDDEVDRTIEILAKRTKSNPILIGDPGVGKTAIVKALAQRIAAGDVPPALTDKTLLSINFGALIAGSKYRGEFEKRIMELLEYIDACDGEVIMFIDEIHMIIGAGNAKGGADASNLLKPKLASGELICIGATTLDEYREHVEKDAALDRRFQRVLVNEPSVKDTISMLHGLKKRFEHHHGVQFTDEALEAAVKLSDRHMPDRFLPDKAIDVIDVAATRLQIRTNSKPRELAKTDRAITRLKKEIQALQNKSDGSSKLRLESSVSKLAGLEKKSSELSGKWEDYRGQQDEVNNLKKVRDDARQAGGAAQRESQPKNSERRAHLSVPEFARLDLKLEAKVAAAAKSNIVIDEYVDPKQIADVISATTGIPVGRLLGDEKTRLLGMEKEIGRSIIGQDDAVMAVSKAVRRSRAGLSDSNRPTGNFLMLGPTGVGKTEMAKSLAAFLFDDAAAVLRIDMSEYGERHAVARLIGAPPGYVGYEQGGALTEAVRRRPYQVVLFDEVEKAHSDTFNIFLQILDEGHLTDGQGKRVNFANTIILFTSNIGAKHLLELEAGADSEDAREVVMAEVRNFFPPELLNRFEEILLFHRLAPEHMRDIVTIQFDRLADKLKEDGIGLELGEDAAAWLAERGYDPHFGARPLRRAMQRALHDPLAKKILEETFGNGNTVNVLLKPDGEGLDFELV